MDDLGLGSMWLAWAASDGQASSPDNVELNPLSGMRLVEINLPVLLNPKSRFVLQ